MIGKNGEKNEKISNEPNNYNKNEEKQKTNS